MKEKSYYYWLILLLISREISYYKFCVLFEINYREWDLFKATEEEEALFDELFDIVVLYSNSKDDHKVRAGYNSENDIDVVLKRIISYIGLSIDAKLI